MVLRRCFTRHWRFSLLVESNFSTEISICSQRRDDCERQSSGYLKMDRQPWWCLMTKCKHYWSRPSFPMPILCASAKHQQRRHAQLASLLLSSIIITQLVGFNLFICFPPPSSSEERVDRPAGMSPRAQPHSLYNDCSHARLHLSVKLAMHHRRHADLEEKIASRSWAYFTHYRWIKKLRCWNI